MILFCDFYRFLPFTSCEERQAPGGQNENKEKITKTTINARMNKVFVKHITGVVITTTYAIPIISEYNLDSII